MYLAIHQQFSGRCVKAEFWMMTWDILETRETVQKKISAPTILREGSKENLRTYDSRSRLQKDSLWHIISGTSGTQTSTACARAQGAHQNVTYMGKHWGRIIFKI
jgi:hypothetical protein